LPLAPRRGGPAIDFRALNYRWKVKDAALVERFIEIYLITPTERQTFSNDALLAPR
jgi:hypothetical protein